METEARKRACRKYHKKCYATDFEFREKNRKRGRERYIRMRTKTPWLLHLRGVKARCNNPNTPYYKYYGAEGIRMYLTKEDIEFLYKRDHADQLKKPSLDRINPIGNYTFYNCRFIEQSENTARSNKAR